MQVSVSTGASACDTFVVLVKQLSRLYKGSTGCFSTIDLLKRKISEV